MITTGETTVQIPVAVTHWVPQNVTQWLGVSAIVGGVGPHATRMSMNVTIQSHPALLSHFATTPLVLIAVTVLQDLYLTTTRVLVSRC